MESDPPLLVPRRAVELSNDARGEPKLLRNWSGAGAYVLLAEPGAGKTKAFEVEARETGGEYTSARDFITLRSQRPKAPIFIDGLDEMRAGTASHRAPLDQIRSRLDDLGRPAFRLSCREADWRSAVDHGSLKAVAPNGELTILHLEELDDEDILRILRSREVANAEEFLANSRSHDMRPLLGNPLLLDLMVDVVKNRGNRWPENRTEIYQQACEQLAHEYNREHRAERRQQLSLESVLDDAGLISALCLLAGIPGVPIESLPQLLGVSDPRTALDSKLFVADADLRIPRHRTIAEFLAAGVIAKRIRHGLPVTRVLSLMSGADGGIVDPLRGLHAWLATRCEPERSILIDRDPLGVVLYGDLRLFSTQDKKHVLHALHLEARRFARFRIGHWESHPFGALGTADMVATFQDLLTASDRTPAHQSLLGCVLDAIEHGEPMAGLTPYLHAVILDPSFEPGTRLAALDAWLAHAGDDMTFAKALLDDVEKGSVSDPDDEMAGRLLDKLYPQVVTPREIARYFHAPKTESLYGLYQGFWRRRFVERTPRDGLRDLMQALANSPKQFDGTRSDFIHNRIVATLLTSALTAHGDDVSIETLYQWMGVTVGEHGFARLDADHLAGARDWLSARPAKLKALVAFGWTRARSDQASERRRFRESEARTLGATRPPDWYAWLLDHAAATDDEEVARYCFDTAAHAAVNPRTDFTLAMDTVELWVRLNTDKWPKATEWLEDAWSVPLDHWEREEKKRNGKYRAERDAARRERRRNIEPYLGSIAAGTEPAGLMNQIASAYDERYSDIHGDTPVERVKDFLGGSREEAEAAITGMEMTLTRTDLPDADDILKTELAGRSHFIRPACLLGASLAFERDPNSILSWPDSLVRTLAAFWLTAGVGEQPEWFSVVAATRPAVVAPVLEKYALQTIRRRTETNVAGLWLLGREERFAEIARLVVPRILRAFPIRANERQLRILSGELLPAAFRHVDENELKSLVAERKALKSLDAAQRIAYLVAGLGLDGQESSRELLELVGTSQSRAAQLGRALELQGGRKKNIVLEQIPVQVTGRLIELIGPHAFPEQPTGVYRVGDADHRRDKVHQLINQLASATSAEGAEELTRLAQAVKLKRWKAVLEGAAFEQSRALRDATFHQASIADVANVLANKSPANPQDLAALFLDHLRIVETQLHGDDTNGLKLFRRDDEKTPKTENPCRDILLDRLRGRLLELGVHIEKEGQAAHDSRTDMRVESMKAGGRITVPIEIKKEDNRKLWSAWRTQLRTYTRDPASEGVGVYLVLWFGLKPRATPEGIRSTTPQQLLDLLSAMIPEEDRFRLHVHVMDLSMTRLI